MVMDLQHFMMESHVQSTLIKFLVSVACGDTAHAILIPLQMSGTSTSLNIAIMYIQLIAVVLKLNRSLHIRVVCLISETFTNTILLC